MNYGFIAPVITPDQYVFGSGQLTGEVLQEDGQWDAYLPPKEYQNMWGLETANCSAFGTLAQIETYARRVFGEEWDKSERFLGIMAETYPPGNNPHVVCEAVRKEGLVDEADLPFTPDINTLQEYYNIGDNGAALLVKGQQWLQQYSYKHDWVFGYGTSDKPEALKDALRFSPIAISVCAWKQNSKGLYYKNKNDTDNHWCLLYGYKDKEYWKIFDSYDNSIKHLEWNTDFSFAKRISLRKIEQVPRTNWLIDIIKRLINIFK